MARTQAQIYSIIVNQYVALAATVGIVLNPVQFGNAAQWSNPPFMSMYNLQGLMLWIVAGAAAITEQLWDAFTTDIEAIVAVAAPQTGPWFQNQMLNVFQANDTTPQVVNIDPVTFAPAYAVVNDTYKVIKYCAVTAGAFGSCLIKVAGQVSGLPVDLDTATFAGCLDTAQSFVNTIAAPGINYIVSSGNSDKIKISATIFYKGQYAAVLAISNGTVVAAIIAYLAAIPFNGQVTLSDLELAIKAVPGVNDVVFTNVQARADATAFGSGTNLVIGVDGAAPTGNIIQRNFATIAGYIETETTGGSTINNTLTYVSQ